MIKPFTMAVDVGGSHVSVALVSDGGVQAQRTFSVDARQGLKTCLDRIEQAVASLLGQVPAAAQQCTGIGMAVPLLVDSGAGRVLSAPRGKFEDAPALSLRSWAEEHLGWPLKLEVDAHAGCLGEWFYGAGNMCEDLVYVTLGTGYGTSVILRGRPLRGRTWQAGILGGHLSVNASGHSCVCPNRGCIEAETGTWALASLAQEHALYPESRLAQHETIDYRLLMEEADRGDALANFLLDRSLSYWGASLVNLTHAYNPQRIIMGGKVLKAAKRIVPYMNDYLRRHVWTASDYPEVVAAQHIDTAALLGCRGLFAKQIRYL